MIVCKECGSTDIEQKRWVAVNEPGAEAIKNTTSEDNEDKWCNKCEDHVNFIDTDYVSN